MPRRLAPDRPSPAQLCLRPRVVDRRKRQVLCAPVLYLLAWIAVDLRSRGTGSLSGSLTVRPDLTVDGAALGSVASSRAPRASRPAMCTICAMGGVAG